MNQKIQHYKAEFFKTLAHPIRISLLKALRAGELTVNELQVALDVEQSTVSQHLKVLRHQQIVDQRKDGTSVYYRVHDPLIFDLLDIARTIATHRLLSTQALLEQVHQEGSGT